VLYGTSVANACVIRVRYYAPTVAATLRVVVTPVGGSPANTDVTLAVNGAFAVTSPASLSLPTSGTDHEVDVEFQAWNAGAGSVYVSGLFIEEAEV
jgi:hypothetical protein